MKDKLRKSRTLCQKINMKFYNWLGKNCINAVSHYDIRKILNKIKKPIGKVK